MTRERYVDAVNVWRYLIYVTKGDKAINTHKGFVLVIQGQNGSYSPWVQFEVTPLGSNAIDFILLQTEVTALG